MSPPDIYSLTQEQFAAVLGGLAEGVTVQDATGQLVYVNDAAARLSGYPTGEAMLAGSAKTALARFTLLDDARQAFPPERLPGRLVLAGLDAPEAVICFRSLETAQERWSIVAATPIRDAAGRVQFAVNSFRDITERKQAEDSAQFVATASRLLAESLDVETTLQQVANLAVPTLADWCVVDLADDLVVRRIALAHVDPRRIAIARELQERYPDDPGSSSGVANVLRTGQAELLADITDEMIEAGARDPEHLHLLRELQLRSYLIVPLIARGRTLGALTLVAAESGRRYSADDLTLANDLAGRAALALDNARLYQESQEQAEAHVVLNAALRETVGERDEAVRRLEEAIRTREEFLSSAAHDLKNPLAGIKGRIQLLGRRARSGRMLEPVRLADELQRIDATVTRAAAQVDDLLDITRLQMGEALEFDRAPVDFVALVQEVVAEHDQRSSKHKLRCRVGLEQIVGEWDRRRLARVVSNLLDNAIRYSPDGGPIDVAVQVEGNDRGRSTVLTVQDSGIGIPADEVKGIFDRFHRGSNVRERIAGTGIGLASAQSIIEAHGGTIEVESQEGVGTTFTVRLPLSLSDDRDANRTPPAHGGAV